MLVGSQVQYTVRPPAYPGLDPSQTVSRLPHRASSAVGSHRGETTLAVLAKHWQPGAVKTRLAVHLGNGAAAALQRAFVVALTTRLGQFGTQRFIWYTPRDARNDFASTVGIQWNLKLQPPGDLGQRMAECFRQHLADPADRCIVLGADSPTLPLEFFHLAETWLQEVPVVLGPTADGGYYMIAARSTVPPLFDGIPWGTGAVWSDTVATLQRLGIAYRELPMWYDVDRLEDLHRLRQELRQADHQQGELLRLAQDIDAILDGQASTDA